MKAIKVDFAVGGFKGNSVNLPFNLNGSLLIKNGGVLIVNETEDKNVYELILSNENVEVRFSISKRLLQTLSKEVL